MMSNNVQNKALTHRQHVLTALRHELPDRQPVDFLATPEIWSRLQDDLGIDERPQRRRFLRSQMGGDFTTFRGGLPGYLL